jgi:hypothetical protein
MGETMKLVTNAIEVWRHYSTGALLAVGAIQGVYAATPQKWIDTLPSSFNSIMAYGTMAIALLGVAGKFIKQDLPSDKP